MEHFELHGNLLVPQGYPVSVRSGEAALAPLGRGGLRVGPLAFGGAPLGNLARPVADADWQGALAAAWDSGIRYFDTAPHYGLGLSEERFGIGLAGKPRDELIVSTKVGRLLEPNRAAATGFDDEGFAVPASTLRVRDYTRDGVLRSLESSLRRLQLERVDILLVHDPDDFYRAALDGAFPALEELRSQRVIRSYGAGMNQSAMLADFVRNTDLDVVLLAGRYTLFEQGALDDLLPLCEERGVSVVAGGVFNSGLLATRRPAADATYNYAPAAPDVLARANRIADVCKRHGVELPAAAVHFVLRHPVIATACLGARSAAEVRRNASLLDARVPEGLWDELEAEGLL
ncbi:MAG: aldo/keto reductase [Chloroflexi bacterium]|nr:aldo/keto reductase [Chloroflexota bacterium]